MERRYVVVCEWHSTLRDDEFDADEIQVVADSAASAIRKARDRWSATIGAEWPHIRLESAWILSPNACRAAGRRPSFGGSAPSYDAECSPDRSLRPPARR